MLSSKISEKTLRKNLIEEINKLDQEKLVMLHQFLAQLVGEELISEVTKDWEIGNVTQESIQAAIEEHRKLHPYSQSEK